MLIMIFKNTGKHSCTDDWLKIKASAVHARTVYEGLAGNAGES